REQGIGRLAIVHFREMRRFEEFPIPFDQLPLSDGFCDRREPLVDGIGIVAVRAFGMVLGRVSHSEKRGSENAESIVCPERSRPGMCSIGTMATSVLVRFRSLGGDRCSMLCLPKNFEE